MATRVTLRTTEDGQAVVEKAALSGDTADRTAEADWLVAAQNSGVVELISRCDDPFTIETAYAGNTTLRTEQPKPDDAAGLLASVCVTLCSLHERNMAHGKLTADHIIVSGPGQTKLCSPDGTIDDPTEDVSALGQIVSELLRAWAEEGLAVPHKSEWQGISDRLSTANSTYSARRAQRVFERLGVVGQSPDGLAPRPERAAPRVATLAVGAVVLFGALLGAITTWSWSGRPAAPHGSNELVIGGTLYGVGSPGQVVVAVPSPCPGQPVAVLLDTDQIVWFFQWAGDGVLGEPTAKVPGATSLTTGSDGCGQVWATGPAGRTLVVGS